MMIPREMKLRVFSVDDCPWKMMNSARLARLATRLYRNPTLTWISRVRVEFVVVCRHTAGEYRTREEDYVLCEYAYTWSRFE